MAKAVAPIPRIEMMRGVKKEFVEKDLEFDETTASMVCASMERKMGVDA